MSEDQTDKKQWDKQSQRADRISKRTNELELLKRFDTGQQAMINIARYLTPDSWKRMMLEEEGTELCARHSTNACYECARKCRGFYKQMFAAMLANSSMNLEIDDKREMMGLPRLRRYETLSDAIDALEDLIDKCLSQPFLHYTRDPKPLQDQIRAVSKAYNAAGGAQLGRIANTFVESIVDELGKNTIPVAERKWVYPDKGKKFKQMNVGDLLKAAGGAH